MTTLARVLDLAALPAEAIPASARAMARFSLFDWIVCGRAGVAEPLAVILRDMVAAEGGKATALLGLGNDRQRERGFARGFRAEHLDNPTAGETTDAQRAVNEKIPSRNDVHIDAAIIPQAYDGGFTEFFLNV